jgi:hypothetical protein
VRERWIGRGEADWEGKVELFGGILCDLETVLCWFNFLSYFEGLFCREVDFQLEDW